MAETPAVPMANILSEIDVLQKSGMHSDHAARVQSFPEPPVTVNAVLSPGL